jgi:uncharacterized protein YwqG
MTGRQDDLEPFLKHPGLSRVSHELARMARNSIRIRTDVARDESIQVGRSKFGGAPDLPSTLEWPTGAFDLAEFPPGLSDDVHSTLLETGGRYYLPFIAQFRLTDIEPYDVEGILPREGMLYFFYGGPMMHLGISASQWYLSKHPQFPDPEDWRVIYYDGDLRNLSRAHGSQALPENRNFGTCTLSFWSSVSLPQVETCFIGDENTQNATLVLTREEWDIYCDLRYEQYGAKTVHKLLGYSDDAQQYAMEGSYCDVREMIFPNLPPFDTLAEADQQSELEDGRLLFQLDAVPEIDMWFGRDGMLYFFIGQDDLLARRFTNCWATEQ